MAAAAAAEWDSGSEAGPTGEWPPATASPVKGKAALPEESDAGASASGSSEAKVDDGNIQEAESSLREGLSLNYEVCRIPPAPAARPWLDLGRGIRFCGALFGRNGVGRSNLFGQCESLRRSLLRFGGRSGCGEGSRFRTACSCAKLNVSH